MSWELDSERERSTFGARRGQKNLRATDAARDRGQMEKNRKIVHLSSFCQTFNSKVIKGFVPELRSRYVFFVFRDSYVRCIYIMNILCTFHVAISRVCNNLLKSHLCVNWQVDWILRPWLGNFSWKSKTLNSNNFFIALTIVMFWPFDPAKNAIQGDALEGSDTFWWQLWEEIAWAEIGWWNGTR